MEDFIGSRFGFTSIGGVKKSENLRMGTLGIIIIIIIFNVFGIGGIGLKLSSLLS